MIINGKRSAVFSSPNHRGPLFLRTIYRTSWFYVTEKVPKLSAMGKQPRPSYNSRCFQYNTTRKTRVQHCIIKNRVLHCSCYVPSSFRLTPLMWKQFVESLMTSRVTSLCLSLVDLTRVWAEDFAIIASVPGTLFKWVGSTPGVVFLDHRYLAI